MENQESLRSFIKTRRGVLLLFGVSIIVSTLYAVYLKKNQMLDMSYVQRYLIDNKGGEGVTVENFIITFTSYLKKYMIVWGLGMVSFVAPLAVSVAMLNVFEYGFATSALYLTFGKNGILIAGQLFVVQGILMIALLLELIGGIIRKNHIFGTEEISGYGTYFISGVIGCLFITCCEIVLALGL